MGVPVNLSCCSIEMKSRVSKVVLSSASVKLSLFFGCCVLQLILCCISCVCLFVVFLALLFFVQLVLDMIVVCSIFYLFLLFSTLFVCSSLSCLRVTAVTLLRWLSEKSKKVDQYWCML